MPFDTLETAQAEIVRLQEENTKLSNERDTLSQNNANLSQDLERVRTLNQQYFNKLTQQYSPEAGKKDEEDQEAPTCEEFAKTLKL